MYLTASEVIELIDALDSFDLLEGVDTDSAIGEHFAEESFLLYGIPDSISRYFDYESYSRDIRLELNCCITYGRSATIPKPDTWPIKHITKYGYIEGIDPWHGINTRFC